ncbi:MAG TPA: glycosyltransferase, partial [Ardenticatenaceae bacterium]|nr:glycosyltransferase [Ardenticatenaceae bacterium]
PPVGEPGSTASGSGLVENDVNTESRGLVGQSAGVEPLVTVITATYNRSGILRHALRSHQLQTFTALESWVVGDGCTDVI